ncbi:M1 family metallopeptidase [Apibacter sp. B3706]|uniref:M1 family metallopeptidase n=1 Tax=Apibacter sp. B3706 TaxID=2656760 RepID=UPI001409ABE0|nr:M1 family metallopeptidase [Apibacter sp. B3706]QII69608.1 M1 family metallopeptidase [Apibacter sp. B3706]
MKSLKFQYVIFLFFPLIFVAQERALFIFKDSIESNKNKYIDHWDVKHYDLIIEPDFKAKFLKGSNKIKFQNKGSEIIQIDLQNPMNIDSILTVKNNRVPYIKKGNYYYLDLSSDAEKENVDQELIIYFSGKPKVAENAPWDGGWIFSKDRNGKDWMTVACEGIGASVWFPCKGYLGDEPDEGMTLTIVTNNHLKGIGNGKLKDNWNESQKNYFKWQVINPINSYNIIPYIGDYVNFKNEYKGEKGNLELSYWVMPENLNKAKFQFSQVKKMLEAFEYWFGPYPFYEDGYKIVEAPYLGMEHQSAIAYGNNYKNGYLGQDRSGTGIGLEWDFIIVHESGHEWFGNNISNADIADMWIHEAFTTYSETLFVEYFYGKEKANRYIIGQRKNIKNDIPIIGTYSKNKKGSTDMYDKGANMIHTIRQIIGNDELFRNILRGLNQNFYHQTVTSSQIENYISEKSGINFSKIFDQYLRTVDIPVLNYYIKDNTLFYKWSNVVKGFSMEINTSIGEIKPTENWKSVKPKNLTNKFYVDENFYVKVYKSNE